MHSPKFPLKVKDLRDVINVARLKSTWKHKVREAMRRQPIPDPLENLDFHTKLDANCKAIEAEVLNASYIPRPPIRFLSEKSKGLCRQLVIPTVKDALILQTLSDALWVEIRGKAPTKKSFYAPNDQGFSKAIKGHTLEYGSLAAWLAFQRTIFGFASTKKYLVVTDIANYYDFISYEHLRNILADLSLQREHALDLLIYTLSCMLWQPDYMPRIPVGLPQINLDAPRLLAHCFLFEIDKFLDHIPGADFARYMDDMDVGVDSVADARAILRDLDLALQTRQIRLNSGKTKILNEREARDHFKIRENLLLNNLADKIAKGGPLNPKRRTVEIAIRSGFRRGTFLTGNGEKILKRLINFARETSAKFSDEQFLEILTNFPGLRSTLLLWWQSSLVPEAKLHLLTELLESGHLVDDSAQMDVATALVASRLPDNFFVRHHVARILVALDGSTPWSLYSRMWVMSKYSSADDLMKLVESRVSMWVTHEQLVRLVAGLSPRFFGTSLQQKFEAIIYRSAGTWSQTITEFHNNLHAGTVGYTSIKGFVLALNRSMPNALTHAKFLMLLSLLHNKNIAPTASSGLKSVHARALSDEFYKLLIP